MLFVNADGAAVRSLYPDDEAQGWSVRWKARADIMRTRFRYPHIFFWFVLLFALAYFKVRRINVGEPFN